MSHSIGFLVRQVPSESNKGRDLEVTSRWLLPRHWRSGTLASASPNRRLRPFSASGSIPNLGCCADLPQRRRRPALLSPAQWPRKSRPLRPASTKIQAWGLGRIPSVGSAVSGASTCRRPLCTPSLSSRMRSGRSPKTRNSRLVRVQSVIRSSVYLSLFILLETMIFAEASE